MKFDTPATSNPIDQLKVIGKSTDRIDGPLKTTGAAPYAYDQQDVVPNQAYGFVVGSAIAKGRIASIDQSAVKTAAGGLAIVTAENARTLGKGNYNTAKLLAGPEIDARFRVRFLLSFGLFCAGGQAANANCRAVSCRVSQQLPCLQLRRKRRCLRQSRANSLLPDELRIEWQRIETFTRCGGDGVADCGCQRRDARLANSARCCA